jgi:trehalose 6-phosphate synthase
MNREDCKTAQERILSQRTLLIASNRGPITWHLDESGELQSQRGEGGLVTALSGLAQRIDASWIASALTDGDRAWKEGKISLGDGINEGEEVTVKFITPSEESYDGYYNVIANPLLWFLQHTMWDNIHSPIINHATWQAWEQGYVKVNQLFAEVIAHEIEDSHHPVLIMLQDYHLYLVPNQIRKLLRTGKKYTLMHFIHIPWPGSKVWGLLPSRMRREILIGLCSVDLLGFQTRDDSLNFIRTCESHLPGCHVNFRKGRIWYRNHATHVRDFPISIDVQSLRSYAETEEVGSFRDLFHSRFGSRQLIVRVDRTEPSKNIARGFQAFDEMLKLYPEHRGKVQFLAILWPSRLKVEEYQNYLDVLITAAGRVNAVHGDSDWEPIRLLVGENYSRAIAALQLYDALLVNSIADGMNLVAKEGPIVNQRNGVVVLSETTGARQQLEPGALVISPWDVYGTANALHQALVMPQAERIERAERLRWSVEQEDISDWFCRQLIEIEKLGL